MTPRVHQQRGFTLLFAVLLATIVLAIGISILNITLKEFLLSNVARESAAALGAADAGLECALYWDRSSNGNRFDLGAPRGPIDCMGISNLQAGGAGPGDSGVIQELRLEWRGEVPTQVEDIPPLVCAIVEVRKYYDENNHWCVAGNPNTIVFDPDDCQETVFFCPAGSECTSITSKGYNNGCSAEELSKRNTVERALRAVY